MDSPYKSLPLTGPHKVEVGHALITLVEPHIGYEQAYNQWYQDDHFFSGALFLPWLFSGRRWVAPYDLQQLRYPKEGCTVANPITKGCYLSLYWITSGRLADHKAWSYSVYQRLVAEDRIFTNRDHVYTSFQDKVCTIYRDDKVPRDVSTLLDPAAGLCLQVIDSPSAAARSDLEQWLTEQHLPRRIKSLNVVSSVMVFHTGGVDMEINPEVAATLGKSTEKANDLRRLTLLWFLTESPADIWNDVFSQEPALVEFGGYGTVTFLAPFIPTKPGTDAYVDRLRGPNEGKG